MKKWSNNKDWREYYSHQDRRISDKEARKCLLSLLITDWTNGMSSILEEYVVDFPVDNWSRAMALHVNRAIGSLCETISNPELFDISLGLHDDILCKLSFWMTDESDVYKGLDTVYYETTIDQPSPTEPSKGIELELSRSEQAIKFFRTASDAYYAAQELLQKLKRYDTNDYENLSHNATNKVNQRYSVQTDIRFIESESDELRVPVRFRPKNDDFVTQIYKV